MRDDHSPSHVSPTIAQVLLPRPLDMLYSYRIHPSLALKRGDFVKAPFRNQKLPGVVWSIDSHPSDPPAKPLKEISQVYDLPPLSEALLTFIERVAQYTLAPKGSILKMVMSVPAVFEATKEKYLYQLNANHPQPERLSAARQKAIHFLKIICEPHTLKELAAQAGVSTSVLQALVKEGIIEAVAASSTLPAPRFTEVPLSDDQIQAAAIIKEHLSPPTYKTIVLDGVTGSGKTEVYFSAIAEALKEGLQSLILLPEIALSAQWLERFKERFGTHPALWHSDLTPAKRRMTWLAIAEGKAQVIVGARSALFLPYPRLGLIVVDEEHDSSFKQEEGTIYNARDMAVLRGHIENIPVVLASATPSLETLHNCQQQKYTYTQLTHRHGNAALPTIDLVDMRKKSDAAASEQQASPWLSQTLQETLSATVERGEQAMLFLNRRGYAPLTLCQTCGERLSCPHCTAWLVEHKAYRLLLCHHCGHTTPQPELCPSCQSAESFVPCGPGVERIAEEVARIFPHYKQSLMTSDTLTGPYAMAALLDDIQNHKTHILIGTQMMAKGHHFPRLTLVGVIDADIGLGGGDLRAAERTFQLMQQVSGRAGRESLPGHVLIQTYMPHHPVLKAIAQGDRDHFVACEMAERKRLHLPPFGRLAALVISGMDEDAVIQASRKLAKIAPPYDKVEILGPAPAILAKLRNRYRWRLLVKAHKDAPLQPFLRSWLTQANIPRDIRVQVDIDPYSFL